MTTKTTKNKKPFYRKWKFLIPFTIILIIFIVVIQNNVDSTVASIGSSPTPETVTEDVTEEAPTTDTTNMVVTIDKIIDGDTVVFGDTTVRVVGVDTPERGACGYEEATDFTSNLVLNKEVTLLAPGEELETDQHGRSLYYVSIDGEDLGELLISNGYAVARYDSTDGYSKHPNQELYHELTNSTVGICEEPPVTEEPTTETPTTQPPVVEQPTQAPSASYKNCDAVRAAGKAPIYKGDPGYGKHLDRDGDGIGCE